ncbi:MAG: hypothetical protein LBR74_02500 [Eubacterium sp.]|jgi:hypothetical protein|nr:hypothetical protein [Eubacterium sp.]
MNDIHDNIGGNNMQNNLSFNNLQLSGTSLPNPAVKYTLERHLQSFEQHAEYHYLWSSWVTEKQEYKRMLESVTNTFDEYSLHDCRHSEKIIENIERLLGENRIRLLSPSNAWMVLQCAYTHDLGMCVNMDEKHKLFSDARLSKEKAKELLENEDFKEYVSKMKNTASYPYSQAESPDRSAFLFWEQFNNDINLKDERYISNLFGKNFTLAGFYFNRIVESWFREKHAERSYEKLLERIHEDVEKDIIPAHMRYAVAEIDLFHCGDWSKVRDKLKRRQNGFNRDYINPSFIAALLRIGDLLDMDTTRFNPYQLEALLKTSTDNIPYLLKDLSVSEILVNPDKICITSRFDSKMISQILNRHWFKKGQNEKHSKNEKYGDCIEAKKCEKCNENKNIKESAKIFTIKAAKEMQKWMGYIRLNAQEFRHMWDEIKPEDFPGCIAVPSRLRILIDGEEFEEKDFEFRYEISPKRSSDIIEGSGLYDDSQFVFLREFIQNAVDATKIKIYRSLRDMKKDDKIDLPDYIKNIMCNDIFSDCVVNVSISLKKCYEGQKFVIKIEDRGIGITRSRLSKMRHIGAIVDAKLEDEIEKMPEWLKPTGNFGIGMQSAFLVTDFFTIKSRPSKTENGKLMQRRIVLNSTRLGGDISYFEREEKNSDKRYICEDWEDFDKPYPFGTMIEIEINLGEGSLFLKKIFSSFSDSGNLTENFIFNYSRYIFERFKLYIKDTFFKDFIPINFEFSFMGDNEKENINICLDIDSMGIWHVEKDNNSLCIPEDKKEIHYWYNPDKTDADCEIKCVMIKYIFTGGTNVSKPRLYYRGIRFYDYYSVSSLAELLEIPGYECEINIMSGEANNIVEINRGRVKQTSEKCLRRHLTVAFRSMLGDLLEFPDSNKLYEKLSSTFYKMLMLEYLTSGIYKIKENPLLQNKNLDCVRFDNLSDDKNLSIYEIQHPLKEYIAKDKTNHWYIDANPKDFDDVLQINDKIKKYKNLDELFKSVIVCNPFERLQKLNYSKLAVFESVNRKNCLIKVYQLSVSEYSLPEIDDYSYYLIIKNIIDNSYERFKNKKISGNYFPAFPANSSAKTSKFFTSLSVDKIPFGADSIEIDNFKQWFLSPLPLKKLCKDINNERKYFWEEPIDQTGFKEIIDKHIHLYDSLISFIINNSKISIRVSRTGEKVVRGLYDYTEYLNKLSSNTNLH